MKNIILILACLWIGGCGSHVPIGEIKISSKFDSDHQEKILQAAEEWSNALPECSIKVSISDDETANVIPWDDDVECQTTRGITNLDSHAIKLCTNGILYQFRISALHELGHALAARDDHDVSGIMFWAYSRDNNKLTAEDLDYVRSRCTRSSQ